MSRPTIRNELYFASLSPLEKGYHLYPHGSDDLVFIIYQPETFKNERRRGSIEPLLQWFLLIFSASLVIYALRKIAKRLTRRITCNTSDDATPEYFLGSLADSLAVFLGVSLNEFGNSRAERWFLISFSIFGLIFQIIYTDNLFVMFAAATQNRITSIDQLLGANVKLSVDYSLIDEDDFYIRSKP